MAIVTGDKYPGWKGNLLVCALSFRHIARVQMSGTTYKGEEKLLQDLGRFRDATEGPDGYIYAVTEGPGLLVKLVPKT
jgi:glucose/arabinose dehydrogenase